LAIFSLICLVEREILLMILPKVYRPLMKSFWIYPARELPMEGINSQWLMDKMINTNKN
jgi:hypothetical protein